MELEYQHIALVVGLFLIPRLLQRFRIPAAVTSLGLGIGISVLDPTLRADPTVGLLATLGIASLFLFAGLEADARDLRAERVSLGTAVVGHVLVGLAITAGIRWGLGLDGQQAGLIALAILCPSTGFILDSIGAWGLPEPDRRWVKSIAIGLEIAALALLFVLTQLGSDAHLGLSLAAMLGLIVLLPLVFHAFAAWILPHAPRSEFAFLLVVATISAVATKKMGAYYLVGAFVVGLVGQGFRRRVPALTSDRMLHAIEMFAGLFVPFYFFRAGLSIRIQEHGWQSLAAGGALLAAGVGLRLGLLALARRANGPLGIRDAFTRATALLPTLVFTLVLVDILRASPAVPTWVLGGLIVYAVATSLVPALLLRVPTEAVDPAAPLFLAEAEPAQPPQQAP